MPKFRVKLTQELTFSGTIEGFESKTINAYFDSLSEALTYAADLAVYGLYDEDEYTASWLSITTLTDRQPIFTMALDDGEWCAVN